MRCPRCNNEISDNVSFCGFCGTPLGKVAPPHNNGNLYLAISILELLFCAWPFAIPALIYAIKYQNAMRNGDYNKALHCEKFATTWIAVSAIVGVIALIIIFFTFPWQSI